jgi:exo-beta-1,3-glucanase (GH17 family)/cellulose synthase/poly-beta-1,6-N-acetylglucosamine synthase-like glycosyltransferase
MNLDHLQWHLYTAESESRGPSNLKKIATHFGTKYSMLLVVAVVVLIACAHAGIWAILREKTAGPERSKRLASMSYSPFARVAHPDRGVRANAEDIRADLKALAPFTRAIRTYSSTDSVELVPAIANELGLKVTVGAWIDKRLDRNESELHSAITLANQNQNINALVVGNETIFRGEQSVSDLIKLIERTKREVSVPVTTGEIWHVWIEHPELAASVDFIAAHILPYWEGFSDKDAVNQAVIIYDKLHKAFPGKRIVIAEFGWPSGGYNLDHATPGRLEQATVLRDFVARADALGMEYNIVEAIDQPWKVIEGSVGPYWGFLDSTRHAKFSWRGPIFETNYRLIAAIAVAIGFLISLILLVNGATVPQAAVVAVTSHIAGAWLATVYSYWHGHYFVPGAAFALGIGIVLLAALIFIMLVRMQEAAAVAFGKKPERLLMVGSGVIGPAGYAPKVSIHIPAYREPPEMLKQTLDAVAALNYPNFECILIINNTPDPALWMPLEEKCRQLGSRFKFINAQKVSGFKAGALRLALEQTAEDTEIIGILDADYTVHPDWLKDLVPGFADPGVGLVQAPQDHRDGARSLVHNLMNCEYAGFFDIGMVQRNEHNAIIVHGTMCLIRRAALEGSGGWSSDTICEDSDLGLAILECGWRALYTNHRYGWGLLPDSFQAFKKQRDRWASGGAQIVKKHWRQFLPNASELTRNQRRQFAFGWLTWLAADSLGVAVALLNLVWVPIVVYAGIAIPDKILTLPIVAAFAVSIIHFIAVYRARVAISFWQMLGAMFAAMSVQWTVARAVGVGMINAHLSFVVTAKGRGAERKIEFQAFWEAVIGALLILGAVILITTNHFKIREIYIFAGVLVLQSLPFCAAVAMALLESSRMNEFGYWHSLQKKFGRLTAQRSRNARARLISRNKRIKPAIASSQSSHIEK